MPANLATEQPTRREDDAAWSGPSTRKVAASRSERRLPPRADRRGALGLLAGSALAAVGAPEPVLAAAEGAGSDAAAVVVLKALLHVNLLPFWRRICDQPSVEGYELNVDAAGRPLGPSNRLIIPQTRTTWFFAHLARSGRGRARDLAIAAHGFRFLTERMWDREHGGFFGGVTHTTHQPTVSTKQLIGHAHALLALSGYALASGTHEAREWAVRTFETIDTRLRDAATGDYRDSLAQDWSGPPPAVRAYNSRFRLVDALTAYHELEGTPTSRDRLQEAIGLAERALVEINGHVHTRSTEPPPPQPRVSYLTDLQIIHQLRRARAALGGTLAPEPPSYRRVLDDALRWGEDRPAGGMFEEGNPGEPADLRYKIGFTQAEALLGLCDAWVRTGDLAHRAGFWRTLLWIARRQADWAHGDWHFALGEGAPAGAKGSPFHTGRSVLRSLELLEARGRRGPARR
jgi:hypothetical protein